VALHPPVRGRENADIHARGAKALDELDQPRRDNIAFVPGERGRDEKDPHINMKTANDIESNEYSSFSLLIVKFVIL
jgi:hypothetical protein